MAYKIIKLKNGQRAALDWLKRTDLPEVVKVLNSVIREGKYLFMNDEITDMIEEQKWFDRGIKTGMLYLIAKVDNKIVGGASITPHSDKRAHTADFGIFIEKSYRDQGIGAALTKTFIEIAKKRGFEILQLSVFETNTRALHVYKKCGYKECGRLTQDIKLLDGTCVDRIMMELLLK